MLVTDLDPAAVATKPDRIQLSIASGPQFPTPHSILSGWTVDIIYSPTRVLNIELARNDSVGPESQMLLAIQSTELAPISSPHFNDPRPILPAAEAQCSAIVTFSDESDLRSPSKWHSIGWFQSGNRYRSIKTWKLCSNFKPAAVNGFYIEEELLKAIVHLLLYSFTGRRLLLTAYKSAPNLISYCF